MSLYAISDLHLSFDEDKPMDIFGTNWENIQEKIRENWKKTVKENDVVLLPGDFCWFNVTCKIHIKHLTI